MVHEHVLDVRPWYRRDAGDLRGYPRYEGEEGSFVAAGSVPTEQHRYWQQQQQQNGERSSRSNGRRPARLDAAVPWLSWDFLRPAPCVDPRPRDRHGVALKAAQCREAMGEQGFQRECEARRERSTVDDSERHVKESVQSAAEERNDRNREDDEHADDAEPEENRTYGTNPDDQGAASNKLLAFQTDRVVRVLDGLF